MIGVGDEIRVYVCPDCGHWAGSTYLQPGDVAAHRTDGWKPRCKMKGTGCSRPLMRPVLATITEVDDG